MSLHRVRILLPMIALLPFVASRADAAALYAYTDLGTINPSAINAQGIVAGTRSTGGPQIGVTFSGYGPNAGQVVSYPESSSLWGINSQGQVFGYTSGNNSFVSNVGGSPDPRASSGSFTSINGINDLGQVVGAADSSGQTHAFLQDGGKMTDLGTLGGSTSAARAINAFGQVVGSAALAPVPNLPFSDSHAFLYSGGRMTDLGTLRGHDSYAVAINASGQVAGSSTYAGGNFASITLIAHAPEFVPLTHAFLYNGSGMTDLGTLGGAYSAANAINASGQVVGTSLTAGDYFTSELHAFVYSGGMMHDINSLLPPGLGWTLISATGINDSGQIVGQAVDANGAEHGYLLTPAGMAAPVPPTVPEPGTLAVFGFAAVGLAWRRLRGRAA